jgi:uncharacterized lipoprotein YajG
MRLVHLAFLVTAVACGGSQLTNLPLSWRGVDESPRPSAAVAQSFAAAPIAFGLRDVRPDPSAVGTYDDGTFTVRTSDNVAQFCSNKLGEMLAHAGARMNETPQAVLEAELLQYTVVEGATFAGTVQLRATVRRGNTGQEWSKIYTGTSKRFGRSHSADNFNEALSNALSDATSKMVTDDDFAHAIDPSIGPPSAIPPPPGAVGG